MLLSQGTGYELPALAGNEPVLGNQPNVDASVVELERSSARHIDGAVSMMV
ncbi:MAG: hypothetical protein ACREXS_16800 [Gammaproteobacteria bacterium]